LLYFTEFHGKLLILRKAVHFAIRVTATKPRNRPIIQINNAPCTLPCTELLAIVTSNGEVQLATRNRCGDKNKQQHAAGKGDDNTHAQSANNIQGGPKNWHYVLYVLILPNTY